MTVVALLALAAVCWAMGRGVVAVFAEPAGNGDATPPPSRERRLAFAVLAGLLVLDLLLLVLDLAGIAWHPALLAPLLAAGALLGLYAGRGQGPAVSVARPGWGVAVAAAAFLVFAVCTALLWNLHPDFIYHWGVKGEKHYLAQGIDFTYLGRWWNAHAHPDYPSFLPALFAVTALLGGGFDETAMALWSALFYLLLLLLARELAARLGASRFGVEAATAVTALVLTMFGVGYLQAGGADWLVAVALLAGAAALAAPPGRGTDVEVGLAAAFGAAAKIEGVALAAFLVAVYLLRRWRASRPGMKELAASAVRAAAPAAAVVAIWLYQVTAHGLFQPANTGDFALARAAVVFPELLRALFTVNWHGVPLCLFALAWLAFVPRTRAIAAVCLLQLAFYVYVYLAAPVDTRLYVFTSAARLFFHLVPAVLVTLVAELDRRTAEGATAEGATVGGATAGAQSPSPSSSAPPPVRPSFLP